MEIYIIAGLVVVAFVFYIVYKIKYGRNLESTANTGRDDYEDDDDEEENNEYDWYLEEDLYWGGLWTKSMDLMVI